MTRTDELLTNAVRLKSELRKRLGSEPQDAALRLSLHSLEQHIGDLATSLAREQEQWQENLEMRLTGNTFASASIPVRFLRSLSESLEKTLGHAVRKAKSGKSGRRLSDSALKELDLRLVGISAGSTRLHLSASSERNLLNEGPLQRALGSIFFLLQQGPGSDAFGEAVGELGPQAVRWLRDLLTDLVQNRSGLTLEWTFRGRREQIWIASAEEVETFSITLQRTRLVETSEEILEGVVEMLSRRNRIILRLNEGGTRHVLYPQKLMQAVRELHLEDSVRFRCQVSEIAAAFTQEVTTTYELLEVLEGP